MTRFNRDNGTPPNLDETHEDEVSGEIIDIPAEDLFTDPKKREAQIAFYALGIKRYDYVKIGFHTFFVTSFSQINEGNKQFICWLAEEPPYQSKIPKKYRHNIKEYLQTKEGNRYMGELRYLTVKYDAIINGEIDLEKI